jgi:hypothetical protein
MVLRFKKKDLEQDGLTIHIEDCRGNPDSVDPDVIYLEHYNGKVLLHVWNGEEDPKTIELEQE